MPMQVSLWTSASTMPAVQRAAAAGGQPGAAAAVRNSGASTAPAAHPACWAISRRPARSRTLAERLS